MVVSVTGEAVCPLGPSVLVLEISAVEPSFWGLLGILFVLIHARIISIKQNISLIRFVFCCLFLRSVRCLKIRVHFFSGLEDRGILLE